MSNALLELVKEYGPHAGETGPIRFVRDMLGVKLDPWQEDVLLAFGAGEKRIAVKSAHNVGKTATASWVVIYNLLCRYPQQTVATAPSSSQLEGALIPRIKQWIDHLNPNLQELLDVRSRDIYLKAKPHASWYETRTTRAENPETMQGIHLYPGYVTLLFDEASAVLEPVYESASGSMAEINAQTFLFGNPTRASGTFHAAWHQAADMWWTRTVSYKDSSRVDEDYVEYIKTTYGEESNQFRIRCLGEFPLADDDTVIPIDLVESARGRDVSDAPDAKEVWGVDVARSGRDMSALVRRTPRRLVAAEEWSYGDIMETTGRVKATWDALPLHDKPAIIIVDEIGLGAGVADRLRELRDQGRLGNTQVRGLNVAESPTVEAKYRKVRDELWFQARDWLAGRDVSFPAIDKAKDQRRDPIAKLCRELVTPTFVYESNGKMKVESKDEMKKRGFHSPNIADAFCLTFAEPATSLRGGTGHSWNQPLHRNIPSLV